MARKKTGSVGWIKWVVGLAKKPETIAIADQLKIHPDEAAGKLMRIWEWCDANIAEKDVSADGWATLMAAATAAANCAFLDEVVGLRGFATAMRHAGWLKTRGAAIAFPNYSRHNGNTAKTRALNSLRQQILRSREEEDVTELSREMRDSSTLLFSPSSEVSSRSEETNGEGTEKPRAAKARNVQSVSELEIPAALNTPEARQAIQDWIDYKRSQGNGYKKATNLSNKIDTFESDGPEVLVAAIRHSIGSTYKGIFRDGSKSKQAASSGRNKTWRDNSRVEPGAARSTGL